MIEHTNDRRACGTDVVFSYEIWTNSNGEEKKKKKKIENVIIFSRHFDIVDGFILSSRVE